MSELKPSPLVPVSDPVNPLLLTCERDLRLGESRWNPVWLRTKRERIRRLSSDSLKKIVVSRNSTPQILTNTFGRSRPVAIEYIMSCLRVHYATKLNKRNGCYIVSSKQSHFYRSSHLLVVDAKKAQSGVLLVWQTKVTIPPRSVNRDKYRCIFLISD